MRILLLLPKGKFLRIGNFLMENYPILLKVVEIEMKSGLLMKALMKADILLHRHFLQSLFQVSVVESH